MEKNACLKLSQKGNISCPLPLVPLLLLSIHVKDSTAIAIYIAIDYNVSLVVAKVQEILTWAKKRVLIEHTLSDP